jgi:hypothetical protein
VPRRGGIAIHGHKKLRRLLYDDAIPSNLAAATSKEFLFS